MWQGGVAVKKMQKSYYQNLYEGTSILNSERAPEANPHQKVMIETTLFGFRAIFKTTGQKYN